MWTEKKHSTHYGKQECESNLVQRRKAVVRVDNKEEESKAEIQLSLIVFNLYLEKAIDDLKENPNARIKIQVEKI